MNINTKLAEIRGLDHEIILDIINIHVELEGMLSTVATKKRVRETLPVMR